MAKTINISYGGANYTLEFTRRTVAKLEENGFNLNQLGEKPATMLPQLFEGAFLAHHRMTKNDIVWEIFSNIKDKEALMQKLAEMYVEPIETLFEEPEDNEKNAVWEATF